MKRVNSHGRAKYFNWINLMTLLFVALVAVWIGIPFHIKKKRNKVRMEEILLP
jgi:flagellar basal body-associated protein FliL